MLATLADTQSNRCGRIHPIADKHLHAAPLVDRIDSSDMQK